MKIQFAFFLIYATEKTATFLDTKLFFIVPQKYRGNKIIPIYVMGSQLTILYIWSVNYKAIIMHLRNA